MTTDTATQIRKGHGIVDLLVDGTIVATAIRHYKSRGHAESGWVITLALDVEAAHRGGSLTNSTAVYLNQAQVVARLQRFGAEYVARTQIDDSAYGEDLTAAQLRDLAATHPAEFVYRALASFRIEGTAFPSHTTRIREELRHLADAIVAGDLTVDSASKQIALIGRTSSGTASRLCTTIARVLDDAADARAAAERTAARPTGVTLTAGELRREVKANGPVEIETPDGWMPYVTTHTGHYHCVVTVMTPTGEIALDTRESTVLKVRTAQTTVVAPRHVPPAAGESRVVHGPWLRRYVGWQWLTPEGEWEFITGARKTTWGRWLITTPSTTKGREWCEPEDTATIRPASGPAEVVKQRNIPDDCECNHWRAEVWTPQSVHEDTDFARYPAANCPPHPALPAGRAVTVAGGVRVDRVDTRCLEMAGVIAPERITVGRIVRTWVNPSEGRRWYDVSMILTGELVSRPAADVASTVDPGWEYPESDGETFPVIFEAETMQPDGSWVHVAANFATAGDTASYEPDALTALAERIAHTYAESTRRHTRVSVIPAKEEYRYLNPDHIGYAVGEPALNRTRAAV